MVVVVGWVGLGNGMGMERGGKVGEGEGNIRGCERLHTVCMYVCIRIGIPYFLGLMEYGKNPYVWEGRAAGSVWAAGCRAMGDGWLDIHVVTWRSFLE